MKNSFLSFSLLIIPLISFGQNNCNSIDFSNYELFWEDNFDYEDENKLTEKWQNVYFGDKCNNFNPYFPTENEGGYNVLHKEENDVRWINNGILNLSIARLIPSEQETPFLNQMSTPITFNYKAGFIRSKDTNAPCETPGPWPYPTYDDDGTTICEEANQGFDNALFVIRAKMGGKTNPDIDGDGFKSSLWLRNPGEEIDIIEYDPTNKKPTLFLTNYHAQQSETDACGAFVETGVDLRDDFHTYAVEWTPYKVTYYFDGEEIRTMDTNIVNGCNRSFNLIASVRLLNGHISDEQLAAIIPFQIDYVKVYHRTDVNKPGKISWTSQTLNEEVRDANTNLAVHQNGSIFYGDANNKMKCLLPNLEDKDSYNLISLDDAVNNIADNISINHSTGQVFYRGTDDKLWYFQKGSNNQWLNFNTHENDNVNGDLAIDSNGKIYYRHDNQIYSTSLNNGIWLNEKLLGLDNTQGELTIDMPSGRMYYLGIDNNIWLADWTNDTNWTKHKLTDTGNVDANLNLKRINGVESIFYAGLDNSLNLLTKTQDEDFAYTNERINGTAYNPVDGSIEGFTKPIDNVEGRIVLTEQNHIFFKGTDDNIWEVYKKPDGHIFYEQINKSPADFASGLISDGRNSMFYVNNQNEIIQLKYSCERLEGNGWLCNSGEEKPIHIGKAKELCDAANHEAATGDELQVCEEFEVYPNPANNFVYIERAATTTPSDCSIRLVDIQGKLIKESRLANDEKRVKIECENIPTGIYILQIEGKNAVANKKIVVDR